MNKTVTINISGIIFHIEEDAYDKLSKYLTTIKGYFRESEGRDEIISDIESRIAEILSERVSSTKQVILMTDVDHVISSMGKPEEFAGETHNDGPEKETHSAGSQTGRGSRRVFRDPDDKVLGGVCSGVGHYFGIDPIWLRLALAISFFVFGFGFLFYILLWIIIPKAKTTADKLEMKGEPVNINNIHRSFHEDMESFKERMKDFKKEASDLGSRENKEKFRQGASRFGEFIEEFFRLFGKVIGKFFAIIFIIIGVSLLIGMLGSFFGVHSFNFGINNRGSNFSLHEFIQLFFTDPGMMGLGITALILLLGIPFLMLIYNGIRILFGLGRSGKMLRLVASVLWAAGLVLGIFLGYKISNDFSETSTDKRQTAVKPAGSTLYINASDDWDGKNDKHTGLHRRRRWNMLKIKDHQVYNYYPDLNISRSLNDSFQVCILASAEGVNEKTALDKARKISYTFTLKDSILDLQPYFSFPVDEHWRNQQVTIMIKVPLNRIVYLNKSLLPLIHNSDVDNVQNTMDDDMVARRWIMTEEGLNCLDCDGLKLIRKTPQLPSLPEMPKTEEGPKSPLKP